LAIIPIGSFRHVNTVLLHQLKTCQEAQQIMAQKGHVQYTLMSQLYQCQHIQKVVRTPIATATGSHKSTALAGTSANHSDLESINAPVSSVQTITAKKRKLTTLDYFVDHALTEKQIDEAHVKLFR